MDPTPLHALNTAAVRLLRPLVRILLRYGVPFAAFADLAKRVYVDVATEEFAIEGRKQSGSRVSVITGLSRKEVRRVRGLEIPDDAATRRYNRAARVIGGWVRDRRYHDATGSPATLPFYGSRAPSFSALVHDYSGDVPARAVLDELVRVGAVVHGDGDTVALRSRAYIPAHGEADKLAILGVDVADLIATIDHNLQSTPEDAYLQRKVAYDNLPADAAPFLRRLTADRIQHLLEEIDRAMSLRDRDTAPTSIGSGRKRILLGIYYREEDVEDEN